MPYTSAQLIAAYTAANNGVAPDAATTTLLTAFATQTQTGQLSDNAALAYVINSADKTTAVANQSYQFFTGKTPLKAGLDYLTNSTANATDLNDPYYATFNIENRYMNFAANLGILGDGATAFNTTYGTTAIPLWSTFVGVIYETIIGSSYAAAAGINVTAAINDVIGRQAAFTQIARERGIITSTSTQAQIDIATRAVAVGYLLVEGIKADVGVYAAGSNNLVNAMINGTAQYNVNLLTVYSPLGGGTGSPIASGGVNPGIPGSTFAFTAGVDALNGTANDDTFNGAVILNATVPVPSTFGLIDTANGNAGNDTLNITVADAGTAAFAAQVTIPSAAITGIETVNVRAVDQGGAASLGVALVATNFAGATAFNNDRSTAAGAANTANSAPQLTITGLASGQAIGVVGLGGNTPVGGVIADYGVAATTANSTLNAIVNLTGGTGSGTAGATSNPGITITSAGGGNGGVTSATINSLGATANVVGNVQLDNGNGNTVRSLNIRADANLTTSAITGFGGGAVGTTAAVTSATIAITGNGTVTTGALDGATAATINALAINTGPGAVTIGGIGAGGNVFTANSTITIAGGATTTAANTAAVNIGALVANVATVNGAGLTAGGVGLTTLAGAASGLIFTGGAATDIVTIGAAGGATFTGTLNAGAGSDIIAFTTGADLAANLTALVSNFEILRVSNAAAAVQTYDPTLINGITAYQVGTNTNAGGTILLTNMAANANVTVFGANAGTNTFQLKDAGGSADVVNIRIDNLSTATTGAAGINAGVTGFGGTATAGQVETLNIVSAGRQSSTGAYNAITLAGSGVAAPGPNYTDPNTVNLSGSVGITLTTAAAVNHAQTISASAHTFGVSIVNTAATTGPFTLIGSAANDTIASSNVASIYGAAGGDSFVLGGLAQTLVYKAASDSVLDLAATAVGAGTGNAQSGVALTGTTKTTGTMDVVAGFTTTQDKIDVSTFGFGAGGLGGGIVDKGTANTDAAFNLLLTTGTGATGVFGDGILQRGLSVIHVGAGTAGGVAADILLIDVNKDGVFTAGSDIAVKFIGAPALVIGDFII